MKVPWKIVGLAGVAGVTAATGVVVARNRRDHTEYDPDELRDKLHSRVADGHGERRAARPRRHEDPHVAARRQGGARRPAAADGDGAPHTSSAS